MQSNRKYRWVSARTSGWVDGSSLAGSVAGEQALAGEPEAASVAGPGSAECGRPSRVERREQAALVGSDEPETETLPRLGLEAEPRETAMEDRRRLERPDRREGAARCPQGRQSSQRHHHLPSHRQPHVGGPAAVEAADVVVVEVEDPDQLAAGQLLAAGKPAAPPDAANLDPEGRTHSGATRLEAVPRPVEAIVEQDRAPAARVAGFAPSHPRHLSHRPTGGRQSGSAPAPAARAEWARPGARSRTRRRRSRSGRARRWCPETRLQPPARPASARRRGSPGRPGRAASGSGSRGSPRRSAG